MEKMALFWYIRKPLFCLKWLSLGPRTFMRVFFFRCEQPSPAGNFFHVFLRVWTKLSPFFYPSRHVYPEKGLKKTANPANFLRQNTFFSSYKMIDRLAHVCPKVIGTHFSCSGSYQAFFDTPPFFEKIQHTGWGNAIFAFLVIFAHFFSHFFENFVFFFQF